jgi:hypothetical protein
MHKTPTNQPAPADADVIKELDFALSVVMAERDQARTELAEAKGRLDALTSAFSADGAIGVLRSICHDASLPHELRYKAAAALAPYETAKKPATVNNIHTLFDTLERAHQRDRELRQANAKVIEAKVVEPASEGDPAA